MKNIYVPHSNSFDFKVVKLTLAFGLASRIISKPNALSASLPCIKNILLNGSIILKWTRRDLNPGPFRSERNTLPLSYEPCKVYKYFI